MSTHTASTAPTLPSIPTRLLSLATNAVHNTNLDARYTTLHGAAITQNTSPLQLLAQSTYLDTLIDALILDYQAMQQEIADHGEARMLLGIVGGVMHFAAGFGLGYWWAKRAS